LGIVSQTNAKGYGRDGDVGASAANDGGHLLAKMITFTDLASAMQVDEDILLRRLATILRKREDGPDGGAQVE
jgi:hypothetical protein